MFVNNLSKNHYGDSSYLDVDSEDQYEKWQAAENKVIFENVNIVCNTRIKVSEIVVFSFGKFNYLTIHYLAEATNGELKLKNVEI